MRRRNPRNYQDGTWRGGAEGGPGQKTRGRVRAAVGRRGKDHACACVYVCIRTSSRRRTSLHIQYTSSTLLSRFNALCRTMHMRGLRARKSDVRDMPTGQASARSATTHIESSLHLLSLDEVLPLCLHVKLGWRVGALETLAVKEEAHTISCVTRGIEKGVKHLWVPVSASPRRQPTHAIKHFGRVWVCTPLPASVSARPRVRTRTLKLSLE